MSSQPLKLFPDISLGQALELVAGMSRGATERIRGVVIHRRSCGPGRWFFIDEDDEPMDLDSAARELVVRANTTVFVPVPCGKEQ